MPAPLSKWRSMSYKLRFHELALQEWHKPDSVPREQFKKKLAERLEEPRIPSAALSGMRDCLILSGHVFRGAKKIIFLKKTF